MMQGGSGIFELNASSRSGWHGWDRKQDRYGPVSLSCLAFTTVNFREGKTGRLEEKRAGMLSRLPALVFVSCWTRY